MHAVILAAGEGSRMGRHSEDVPKAFMEIGDRSLYDRQRQVLADHVDGLTVVLGYRAERVVDRVGPARTVVVSDWDEYDNAESLRRAIVDLDDDVLVLNGDVVVTTSVVERLIRRHDRDADGRSVVGCLPGVQTEHTALAADDDGTVTDYGMIPGRRHAGVGIIDRGHLDAAERCLGHHREEWYPVVYTRIATRLVAIPPEHHFELNRPQDRRNAERQFPIESLAEPDLSS